LAACEVEPEASGVENSSVRAPKGRLLMKGWTLTLLTLRPSSALILTAEGATTTPSLPSPGTWL
jgi:hypothetical protein